MTPFEETCVMILEGIGTAVLAITGLGLCFLIVCAVWRLWKESNE